MGLFKSLGAALFKSGGGLLKTVAGAERTVAATEATARTVTNASTIVSKTVKDAVDNVGKHVKDLKFSEAIKDSGIYKTGSTVKQGVTQGINTVRSSRVVGKIGEGIGAVGKVGKGAFNKINAGHISLKGWSPKYSATSNALSKVPSFVKPKIAPTLRGATYVGLGVMGAGFGATRVAMNNSMARTYNNKQGMDPNNLSTDGLTLALSKRRHR